MNPIKQLLQFSTIGLLNTGIDALSYFALTRFVEATPLTASALSFLVGSLNSFLLNKRWTFADPAGGNLMLRQYAKFFLVTFAVLSVHQAALLLLHHQFGLPDLVAKAAGIVFGMALGFRLNRRWVFGLKQRTRKPLIIFAKNL